MAFEEQSYSIACSTDLQPHPNQRRGAFLLGTFASKDSWQFFTMVDPKEQVVA